MENRKRIRGGIQVIHRHRIGRRTFRRVSELVFAHGEAKAVLGWIDLGGVRTPVCLPLDRSKLRKPKGRGIAWYYDEVTADPRFEELQPLPDTGART